jgi:glucose-1-phosphatase
MKNIEDIRNIIFDLGGVIVDIDLNRTFTLMHELGIENMENYITKYTGGGFAEDFQTGKMSDEQFIATIQQLSTKTITPNQIEDAWNAMIMDYETERIIKLKALKQKYRTFVLSNTNIIHYRNFAFRVPGETHIDNLFEKTYYSHEIGFSKPNKEAFEVVLKDAGLIPNQTLFLDDSPANVAMASQLGMQARVVEHGNDWLNWI